jgi:hypothetical protein
MIEIVGTQITKAERSVSCIPSLRQNDRTGIYASSKNSRKLRDAQTRYVMRKVRTLCPFIRPEDIWIARRFAELEYLASRCYAALRDSEIVNGKGESKRLLTDYRRLVQTQLSLANSLGLSPAARMAIKANSANAALDLVGQFAADAQSERRQIEGAKADE